jgi:hypothetical protein
MGPVTDFKGLTVRTAILILLASSLGMAVSAQENAPVFQAFFGSLQLDDQTADWDDISDAEVDVDFSSLPSGGLEFEYTYGGEALRWGINSGGSIAWKNDGTRISGGFSGDTGGVIRVELDNSLFLGELHLGLFLRANLGSNLTLYGAAGPMVMYGRHKVEDEEVEEAVPSGADDVELSGAEDSDFAFGGYARAGLDFEFKPGQQVGIGVRYMQTHLDFDDTIGKLDIEGPQYVITYTAAL